MQAIAKGPKAQAAIDFMTSYGVVILVIAVALTIILGLNALNIQPGPSYCNTTQSFSCGGYVITTNGVFTFTLSQSVGGYINVTGIACSTAINSTGNAPRYGNIGVTGASKYYPTNGFTKGTILFGNALKKFSIYCYGPTNVPANGILGNQFIGYVWMNYTNPQLPAGYSVVQQALTFSTEYT